jgi:excisionase family DNA binding protein
MIRHATMRRLMKTNPPPAETKPAPQLITPAALRQRWAVSNMFLWRARRDGKLPAVKLGKHVRFVLADVEKFEAELRS